MISNELYELYKPLIYKFPYTLPTPNNETDLPSPTKYNPKYTGRGVVWRKVLRLGRLSMIVTLLFITFLLVLAALGGFYAGMLYGKQEYLNQRLTMLERGNSEYKNIDDHKPGNTPQVTAKKEIRRIPRSSVMKYPSPQEMRKNTEKMNVATIEKEMLTLAKEFGSKGSMEVI